MKKKFLPGLLLCLFAIIFSACTNILGEEKKSSDFTGIELSLPYAKNNKVGVFRAGDATNNRSLKFEVTFKHIDSGTETSFKGKSGEKIIFEKAPVGLYDISVYGYEDDGNEYEGDTDAEVKDGETTTVTIFLKRIKKDEPINEEPEPVEEDPIEINLLCHTDEQIKMIDKYIKSHPGCNIHLNYEIVETTNGQYTSFLDDALTGKSDKFIPDIYTAEAGFVLRYTKGQMSQYALPYKDFISNLDSKITDAEIAQYTVDIGKNADKEIAGLAYQTTGGAFIYRRSVAENVWGSQASDISFVENKIGAGSGKWDEFWNAAAACKEKGVAIVSGDGDLWHPVEASAEKGWVVNGKLHIDSKREAFLDYSKDLWQNEYSNKTVEWSEDWNNDARGAGVKPVLGFFGPAWLLNYALAEECKKDADTSNDTDWAICQSPVGFSWGGTWVLANKKLTEDTSDEGKKKLEAISKIIEWMTLDASEGGLQYQWANGLLENTKDTVASKVVMDKSNGELDFLGGQNMYTAYSIANANAKADTLTEYDEKINTLWRFEVNKYAEGLTTREQALLNFKIAVYSQLGLESEDFGSDGIVYETEHVKAEPDPNGKGIKFTLTCKEGESWNPGASFIWETKNHYGIRITNVPTPGNPVVCYYPITEDKGAYSFDCELEIVSGNKITESLVMIANGGNESINIQADNFDISLSGGVMKLSKDTTFKITKSANVKPYLDFIVETTDGKTGKDRFDIVWKDWLNSSHLEYSDEMISTLKNDGYTVLAITNDTYSKLQKNNYYFANLSVEFTIDGIPESFRTWVGMNSEVVEFDKTAFESDTSEHVHAEPDPDGKGIKFTISAKEGEEWREEDYRITELNSGIYIDLNKEKLPNPGNPFVCYWPFTNAGETYFFDCELKLSGRDIIHESVSSTANGSYASVNIDYDDVKDVEVNINSADASAKLSKDISSSISYSDNVTATFDFGSFANNSSNEYKWTEWLSSRFIPVNNQELYDSGTGISLLDRNRDTVVKLKNHKYFFTEATLNFEIEGIEERFRSSSVYRTDIIDSSDFLTNLNENTHISAEPCDEGVKITLRHLESDGEWCSGYVNNINCLTKDGENGVAICLYTTNDFENGVIPEEQYGNRSPTDAESEVTYIYPFTEKDKLYEFEFAGPLDTQGSWHSEYVCCKAGGGLGELIDADEWNENVKITDIIADPDKPEFSFKVQGDVASIIDNSKGVFTYAEFCPDIRPGVAGIDDVDHRGDIFGYASRRVILVGDVDDYNRGPEAFVNPFVIENNPAYYEGNLNAGDYDNENVFEVLDDWGNTFFVLMSIQKIQLQAYPDTIFYLHWK